MNKRVNLIISGRVQGVFFRANAKEAADSIGVKGFVRNLPDGTVEVEAEGTEEQISALQERCSKGWGSAQIDIVKSTEKEYTGEFTAFEVCY